MKMIRALIKTEKVSVVLKKLKESGFPLIIKVDLGSRGQERELKVADIHYDGKPQTLLLMTVSDDEKNKMIKIIAEATKRENQVESLSDGKIFISQVEEIHTVGNGEFIKSIC